MNEYMFVTTYIDGFVEYNTFSAVSRMIAEGENFEYLFGKGVSYKDIKSIKCFVFSHKVVNYYDYSGHCDGRCLNCDDFDPIRGCTYEPDEDKPTEKEEE